MPSEDTIAAVSTPPGTGGISIVRISGDKAFEIASAIFRSRGKKNKKGTYGFGDLKSHSVNYGVIVDNFGSSDGGCGSGGGSGGGIDGSSGEVIDEVLLVKMAAPDTFTREDTVEIDCHGGYAAVSKILETVIRNGARPAAPGEFTKRAFLNGRIDLVQAEAVIDMVNAKTGRSLKAAVNQLEGRLSREIKGIRESLLEIIASNEALFDYPEHEIEDLTGEQTSKDAAEARARLAALLRTFEKARISREGISVVIAGKPNVGKSSLMNEITGVCRAIVTDMPGTTRDILEEYINFHGMPLKIIDTAGIRTETRDEAEKIGVEKARKALENADILIVMLDASTGISREDIEILKAAGGSGSENGNGSGDRREIEREETNGSCDSSVNISGSINQSRRRPVFVINKADTAQTGMINKMKAELADLTKTDDKGDISDKGDIREIISISVKTGEGLDELENELKYRLLHDGIEQDSEELLTNIRHKDLVEKAISSLDSALEAYGTGMTPDCVEIDIREAAEYLGGITGESVTDDMVDLIFSRFCIGK